MNFNCRTNEFNKKISVAGSGVLGYQIAFQTAFHGFDVTVYDINAEIVNRAKSKFDDLAKNYRIDIQATDAQIAAAKEHLSYTSNLEEALKDADLLIEAIPEEIQIKKDFYKQAAQLAADKTIFASNSSTLLPSQFADSTGRPQQFLNLHFANQIWLRNTAEIMAHPKTDENIKKEIIQFSKDIGMVPIVVNKEYILSLTSSGIPKLCASWLKSDRFIFRLRPPNVRAISSLSFG
ncbi:MAG TPA: hypothetical protein DCW66_05115 [Sphingobacterium sp.]|nr:hypothetical protein [Sphingobacterium sp.]